MNLGSESETVEFKKSTGEHKEALQAISAMLNKHGRGELYFGVKDNGDVIGQDVSDATLRQVTSWVSDKIEPAVFPTVECLDADDGLRYIKMPSQVPTPPTPPTDATSPAWGLRTKRCRPRS